MGVSIGPTFVESNWAAATENKRRTPLDLAVRILEIYSAETKVYLHGNLCTRRLAAALFAPNLPQSRCKTPRKGSWFKKWWRIHQPNTEPIVRKPRLPKWTHRGPPQIHELLSQNSRCISEAAICGFFFFLSNIYSPMQRTSLKNPHTGRPQTESKEVLSLPAVPWPLGTKYNRLRIQTTFFISNTVFMNTLVTWLFYCDLWARSFHQSRDVSNLSFFLLPVLLRCGWQTALHTCEVYSMMIWSSLALEPCQ